MNRSAARVPASRTPGAQRDIKQQAEAQAWLDALPLVHPRGEGAGLGSGALPRL